MPANGPRELTPVTHVTGDSAPTNTRLAHGGRHTSRSAKGPSSPVIESPWMGKNATIHTGSSPGESNEHTQLNSASRAKLRNNPQGPEWWTGMIARTVALLGII
jgi:hypothetical protein